MVGYFALIVVFTFGLQKMVMESRMRVLEEKLQNLNDENRIVRLQARENAEHYYFIRQAYEQISNHRGKK